MAKRGRKSIHELMKDEKNIDWNYGTINGKYSKYTKGDRIINFNEFINQEVFIYGNFVKNRAWLLNQQLRVVLSFFSGGVYYAIPKEKKEKSGKAEIIIKNDDIRTSYTLVTFPNEKYFLKFKRDNFMIEITKEQFQKICEDINFENMIKIKNGATCYTPLAERIRNEYIAKKFNMEE